MDENKGEAGRCASGDMDREGGRKDVYMTVMNLLTTARVSCHDGSHGPNDRQTTKLEEPKEKAWRRTKEKRRST